MSASDVNAAEPIANPFPIAAVVFPAASRASVRLRMSLPISAISAIPPALSDTGPYASIVRPTAMVPSIPIAAIAMPYIPANEKPITTVMAIIIIGSTDEL